MKFIREKLNFAGRDGFNLIYPPTKEQVLLQYYSYHRSKQYETGGTSSRREAMLLVVEDIQKWWSNS